MAERRRRTQTFLVVGAAVLIGVMTSVQARVNGVLGSALDDGIAAGLVSFTVGLVLLSVAVLLVPSARVGVVRAVRGARSGDVPLWMLTGGACGALTVTTQGIVAGFLGVALFSVGVVAGQSLHGLLLDRAGVGPAGAVAVTTGRILGGGLALVAVGVSLSGEVLSRAPLWMLVLPFLAGVGIAWQSAVNGRLGQRIGSALSATFLSFTVGTIVLAIGAVLHALVAGVPRPLPADPILYLGGLLGAVYILLGIVVVSRSGVLLLGLGSVLGQLTASVAIDLLWPPVAGPASWQLAVMVTAAALAVLVALPRRRHRGRAR